MMEHLEECVNEKVDEFMCGKGRNVTRNQESNLQEEEARIERTRVLSHIEISLEAEERTRVREAIS